MGWHEDAFLAGATLTAGVLGYGFSLVLSRSFGPTRFGELSALLAVVILATVPGTALQAGIARSIATEPSRTDDAALLGQAALLSVAVGAVLLLLAPVVRSALGVQSWASLAWLAATMVPTTFSFGCLGVLQGRRRFVALGRLLVLVQAAKLVAGVIAAATGTGIPGALSGTAVLTSAVVAVAVVKVAPISRPRDLEALRGVFARDAIAVLGVLLLSNLDLVLARHYLSGHDAGLYAAGNLVTKVAFWGPAFVPIIAFPRLSRPDERRAALTRGSALVCMLGVVTVAVATLGEPLLPLVVGHAYRPVAGIAWLFALQGAALAAILLGVYAGLAVHNRWLGLGVWVVAAAETAAVALAWHRSVRSVLAVVLCGSAVLLVAAAWQQRATFSRHGRASE